MKLLYKLYDHFVLKNFYVFLIDPDTTRRIIEKLNASAKKDYISRSYNQFYGYIMIQGKLKIFILNLISFFIIPPLILLFLLFNIFYKTTKVRTNSAISFAVIEGIIPSSLLNKYRIIESEKTKYCLTIADIFFIIKIAFRYPFSYFFILKNLIKIANFSYLIKKFNCSAIIQTYEYSFTSSISTMYCENHGIKHINVMHGEKVYYIRDSFFSFHECYVWDEYYKKLFISLGAEPNQFIIEYPPVLNQLKEIGVIEGKEFKYYLDGTETIEQILSIKSSVENKFKNLIFRPHPRFSDILNLERNNIRIEDPGQVKIVDSLKECNYVCSKYSTVLFQALIMKKKIVVDDIMSPELYKDLIDREYIIFSKPHLKLSDILK
jgi:hypothetical protein